MSNTELSDIWHCEVCEKYTSSKITPTGWSRVDGVLMCRECRQEKEEEKDKGESTIA